MSGGQLRRIVTVAAVAGLLAACGSDGNPAAAPTLSVQPSPTPTPSTPATPAGPDCLSAEQIAAWSVQRRAATVVTLPVLDFDLDALAPALAAGAGGVLFLGSSPAPKDLAKRIRAAVAKSPGTPLIMADQEGGGIQRLRGAVPDLPWPADLASSATPEQVRTRAAALGRAMAALGVTVDLAPVLDVDDRPGPSDDNPDGKRSFSGDPATVTRYGLAFMRGLIDGGVVPVVKHFPGLGGTTGNTDVRPAPTKPIATLRAGDLDPFREAVRLGAPAVMVANATVPGVTTHPAGLSSALIRDLLRDELGFTGLVVTDSLSAGAVRAYAPTLGEAVADAIESGADLVLFGSTLTPADRAALSAEGVQASFDEIVAAVTAALDSGALTDERLNTAVTSVLRVQGEKVCG